MKDLKEIFIKFFKRFVFVKIYNFLKNKIKFLKISILAKVKIKNYLFLLNSFKYYSFLFTKNF